MEICKTYGHKEIGSKTPKTLGVSGTVVKPYLGCLNFRSWEAVLALLPIQLLASMYSGRQLGDGSRNVGT